MTDKKNSNLVFFLIFAAIGFSALITFAAENMPSDLNNSVLKHLLLSAGMAVFAVYIAFAIKLSSKHKEEQLDERISQIEKNIQLIKKKLGVDDEV